MSEIYSNVIMTECEGMNERLEMMVDIYESADSVRDRDFRTDTNTQQPLQSSGSECVRNRNYRAATVCLVLLCVLLLTAVIVLCVLINTNNHQLHNLTEERDQLLTNNTNLTEERNQLLTNNTNLTEERDQLLTNNKKLTEERDQLLTNNKKLTEERNQQLTNLTEERDQLLTNLTEERDQLLTKIHDLNKQNGWTYYQSSFYYFSSEQKSWKESRRYCIERGADLVIINNTEEQDFVLRMSGTENIWIGLSDSDVEGSWKWVDGRKLYSRFWSYGEPNGGKSQKCVSLQFYSSRWYDYSCYSALYWICEKSF